MRASRRRARLEQLPVVDLGGHKLLLCEEAFGEQQTPFDRSRRHILCLLGFLARCLLVCLTQQLHDIHVVTQARGRFLQLDYRLNRLAGVAERGGQPETGLLVSGLLGGSLGQ